MPVYILWIPCLQGNLNISTEKIEARNISDDGVFYVDASLNPETYEVRLSYCLDDAEQKSHEMVFTLFQKPVSCFLHYQITKQTETTSQLAQTLQTEFHQGLYHLFKDFFHEHTFHAADEDSIIHARCFQTQEEYLQDPISDADYYVEEYIKKFIVVNKDINDKLLEMRKWTSTPWKQIRYYLNTYRCYKRLVDKFCRYNGEYLFYESLRKSVPNQLANSKSVDERMKSIDGEIRIKQYLVEKEFSYNSAVIGTNVSTIGTLIGLLGIVLTVFVTCTDKNSKKLEIINNRLNHIDVAEKVSEIKMTLDETGQRILNVDNRIDSINDDLRKVQAENESILKKLGVK